MRCKLHIGTEKTGSSYLQCTLALARDQLLRSGVWFEIGAPFDEKCMKSGRISGGNALKMAEEIEQNDWGSVKKRLLAARQRAKDLGATSVLISSELLLRPLSVDGRLSRYVDVLRSADFPDVSFLLMLRKPADQLLSLYKHRAKRGTAGDLAQWCDSGYQVPQELAGFRLQAKRLDIDLEVRGYSRESGELAQRFFADWLGVPVPAVELPSTVNPSLSLSELEFIRRLAEIRVALVGTLYGALVVIDSNEKVQGKALDDYAKAVAAHTVARHADEWRAWNRMLPSDEQFEIPAPISLMPPRPTEIGFSETQLAAVAQVLARSATPRFIAGLFWRHRLRPMLGRLKRTMFRLAGEK